VQGSGRDLCGYDGWVLHRVWDLYGVWNYFLGGVRDTGCKKAARYVGIWLVQLVVLTATLPELSPASWRVKLQ
jgi:hypothetical protein